MEQVASDMERSMVTAGAFGLGLVFAMTATLAGARLLQHQPHAHAGLVAQVNGAAGYQSMRGGRRCVEDVVVVHRPRPTLELIPLAEAEPLVLPIGNLMPTWGGPFGEVIVIDSFPAVR